MSLGNSAKNIAGNDALFKAKASAPFVGILDIYPTAAVAYSVRKLQAGYTGASIRVRRSSDNAEQDISFLSNGNLDENSLTTFVGANNGYVTTWYDQSGNGNNATQTTAIYQPLIVKAGIVEKVNGKPAVDYNSPNVLNHSLSSVVYPNVDMLIYYVAERTTANKTFTIFGGGNTLFGYYLNNVLYFYGAEAWANGLNSTPGQMLMLGTANPTNYKVYQNNTNKPIVLSVAPYSGSYSTLNYYAGTGQSGKMQEGIIWNIDRTSDRTGITDNVNTYYAIF